MSSVESASGVPADTTGAVWDLVEGFGLIVRVISCGDANPVERGKLAGVAQRLSERALRMEKQNISNELRDASEKLRAAGQ